MPGLFVQVLRLGTEDHHAVANSRSISTHAPDLAGLVGHICLLHSKARRMWKCNLRKERKCK